MVPWLKATSASAEGGRRRRSSSASRNPVGAVAVQEDDELACLACARLEPRTVELSNHSSPCRLDRRGVAPFDGAIIGPQELCGHPAPWPPRFGKRDHVL